MGIAERLKNAWNIFRHNNTSIRYPISSSTSSSNPQYRTWRYTKGSIVDTIVNRIAIDVSMVEFRHVRKDSDPNTEEIIFDGLQECLSLQANIDQSNIEFIQDIVVTMMDAGVVAVVPVDTDDHPEIKDGINIYTMRVGKIVEWYPREVKVNLYNDNTGEREDIIIGKNSCAIITNPLYDVVNSGNSTLKRLTNKLALMDVVDDNIANAKMDLILQLPYTVRSETRRREAEERIKRIEEQLTRSKYGIGYVDATEKITQLNRAVENNLLKEVEYLTTELYNQLGLTSAVFNGTANESEARSYYDRTINPIAKRIAKEFTRKFFSQNARTRGHKVVCTNDMFRLVPMEQLATTLDTLRRNVIISTNEAREIIGFQPIDDPRANELSNPNIADVNQMPGMMDPAMDQQVATDQQTDGGSEEEQDEKEL